MSSESSSLPVGAMAWTDLTVADATGVRDFYQAVVGWTSEGVDMDGYEDYMMNAADGSGITGICHARGSNAALPPVWLVYFNVADVATSIQECTSRGGEVVHGPRDLCGKDFCVIRDPAGAMCGLIGPEKG